MAGSHADVVRAHCGAKIIEPARQSGRVEVEIRVGDIHADLGFKNRLPLVCSALGSAVFEKQYRVRRTAVDGPLNGANTLFRFEVLP